MIANKYNQSIIFDANNSPNLFKTRLSSDINKSKTGKGKNVSSFKCGLKKIEKNKFKNIPKNENLMNFSTILDNNDNNKVVRKASQRKTCYMNFLSNKIIFTDALNIKKKLNDNKQRVSSLIPISKNRNRISKMKTIKEKDNLICNIFKKHGNLKKNNKLNVSFNEDVNNKNHKNRKISFSSNALIKMKKKKSHYSNKLTDIKNNIRKISSKIKISPNKEVKATYDSNKENNHIKSKKSHKIKEYYIRDSKTSENKRDKSSSMKERKFSEIKKDSGSKNDKFFTVKESKISNKKIKNINDNKNEKKNEDKNAIKNAIDINNVKTKTDEQINCAVKEKKKKYLGFPFCCCLTSNNDNSSDNE